MISMMTAESTHNDAKAIQVAAILAARQELSQTEEEVTYRTQMEICEMAGMSKLQRARTMVHYMVAVEKKRAEIAEKYGLKVWGF